MRIFLSGGAAASSIQATLLARIELYGMDVRPKGGGGVVLVGRRDVDVQVGGSLVSKCTLQLLKSGIKIQE